MSSKNICETDYRCLHSFCRVGKYRKFYKLTSQFSSYCMNKRELSGTKQRVIE